MSQQRHSDSPWGSLTRGPSGHLPEIPSETPVTKREMGKLIPVQSLLYNSFRSQSSHRLPTSPVDPSIYVVWDALTLPVIAKPLDFTVLSGSRVVLFRAQVQKDPAAKTTAAPFPHRSARVPSCLTRAVLHYPRESSFPAAAPSSPPAGVEQSALG